MCSVNEEFGKLEALKALNESRRSVREGKDTLYYYDISVGGIEADDVDDATYENPKKRVAYCRRVEAAIQEEFIEQGITHIKVTPRYS